MTGCDISAHFPSHVHAFLLYFSAYLLFCFCQIMLFLNCVQSNLRSWMVLPSPQRGISMCSCWVAKAQAIGFPPESKPLFPLVRVPHSTALPLASWAVRRVSQPLSLSATPSGSGVTSRGEMPSKPGRRRDRRKRKEERGGGRGGKKQAKKQGERKKA